MKAPDKIYLHRTTGNPRLNGKVHSYKPAKIRDDDKIIEYIRKDAILEWAKGKKEEYEKETSREYDGCMWVLNLLIEKLESL